MERRSLLCKQREKEEAFRFFPLSKHLKVDWDFVSPISKYATFPSLPFDVLTQPLTA